jgi:hypothetical protein
VLLMAWALGCAPAASMAVWGGTGLDDGNRKPLFSAAHVRFSNRPFRVKRFQTIHHYSVDVAHGLALLFGIGTKALVWDFFSQEVQAWWRIFFPSSFFADLKVRFFFPSRFVRATLVRPHFDGLEAMARLVRSG